jgi:transposase
MQLEIAKIRRDGGTQPRAKLSEDTVNEYMENMRAGDVFRPVTVFFDGADYWLSDGFHRVEAKLRLDPLATIDADVEQGTLEEAQWHSFSVNKSHGMRRNNEDKERAVRAALRHVHAEGLSNRQIAEHCGVNEKTVRNYRDEMNLTAEIPQSPESQLPEDLASRKETVRARKGRDGRTINTAQIGKSTTLCKRRRGKGVKLSRKAYKVRLGHSAPNPMIALQFSPNNAHTAAATLIQEFSREWVETLIQELTQFLVSKGGQV